MGKWAKIVSLGSSDWGSGVSAGGGLACLSKYVPPGTLVLLY